MAQILKSNPMTTDFWAVDKVILPYLACVSIVIVIWWSRLPLPGLQLALHLSGIAVALYEIKRPNPTSWIFRNWYPLPYVASCYKVMAVLIPAVRGTSADHWLANLDYKIWNTNPTVWLERVHHPALTEALQIVYTAFIPAVLLIPFLIWQRRQYGQFQYMAFLIALGFLTSYIGYLIVPARGPRFLLSHLQHFPLQGEWFFASMQATLDRLESAHYDCFPSGHTELTILACWGSRYISKGLFRIYFAYTLCIIFATVYLRYHYTVDLMAGIVLAAVLIWTAPRFYSELAKGGAVVKG